MKGYLFCIILLMVTSCSYVNLYKNASSFPNNKVPDMVYFHNEVKSLAPSPLLGNSIYYIEYATATEPFIKGKLLEIRETDLLISKGYFETETEGVKELQENSYFINKDDILVMKVWRLP